MTSKDRKVQEVLDRIDRLTVGKTAPKLGLFTCLSSFVFLAPILIAGANDIWVPIVFGGILFLSFFILGLVLIFIKGDSYRE